MKSKFPDRFILTNSSRFPITNAITTGISQCSRFRPRRMSWSR